MQIIRLHKNVYNLYTWARTKECLDAHRIKYEDSVRHWDVLHAEGVSVAKYAEFAGTSRATYYRHKRVLKDLAQTIIPPSMAPSPHNSYPELPKNPKKHLILSERSLWLKPGNRGSIPKALIRSTLLFLNPHIELSAAKILKKL